VSTHRLDHQSSTPYTIALMRTSDLLSEDEKRLTAQMNCAVIDYQPLKAILNYDYILSFNHAGMLQLQSTRLKNMGAIFVDFTQGSVDYRRQSGGGRSQAIAKAVGLNDTKYPLNVLDCTAGMGNDAFVLATLGCKVTMLERSIPIALLLEDGWMRAKRDSHTSEIAERICLHKLSAHHYLQNLLDTNASIEYDVIYLDPMFPYKNNNAASKKAMQYFQALLSGDADADELLLLSLKTARYRVVVKRSRLAPDLGNISPTYRLIGESSRFDIYTIRSFKHQTV